MTDSMIEITLILLTAYLAIGLCFAPFFLAKGLARVDPISRQSSLGFRVLTFPGMVLLWPVLATKWKRA